MSTKLYVGNLPLEASEGGLRDLFAPHGTVTECHLVLDLVTRNPRGFAFVTMETQQAAEAAILAVNGKDWEGRALKVNEARPREERPKTGGEFGGPGGPRGNNRGDRNGRRFDRR